MGQQNCYMVPFSLPAGHSLQEFLIVELHVLLVCLLIFAGIVQETAIAFPLDVLDILLELLFVELDGVLEIRLLFHFSIAIADGQDDGQDEADYDQ